MGNIKKKEVGAVGRRRQKKKAIRAMTTNMSSKRKLSRLGKIQEKGKSGLSALFISRNQALNKLQITLRDFRRLCILKGIHPRDPKLKNKSSTTSYYHVKDITFLAHEPLLQKFRDFKIFMKKVKHMAAKRQYNDARAKYEDKPEYTLMHLVKERYPTFQSAVQDLDDALCMAHLFGQMKVHGSIGTSRTGLCQRFCREWQLIVVKTNALRKAFVSVKGFYYEAEIAGERVVWLIPHMFAHQKPKDVDIRIMSTFLEFYETYLKFVLFKLYHDAGLSYPPVIEEDADNAGSFLAALSTRLLGSGASSEDGASSSIITSAESASARALPAGLAVTAAASGSQAAADADAEAEAADAEVGETLEEEFKESEEAQQLQELRVASKSLSNLFSKLRFFISRECPRDSLEFVILSFNGQVGWEGPASPFGADDPKITHHIVDRPSVLGTRVTSREYIQPQWIYDCVNFNMLLPIKRYEVGTHLPPHLSPFTDDISEGYMPAYREEVLALQVAKKIPSALELRRKLDEIEAANAEAEDEDVEKREMAISMMTKKKRRLHDRIEYGQGKKAALVKALADKREKLDNEPQADDSTAGAPAKKRQRKRKKTKAKAKKGDP